MKKEYKASEGKTYRRRVDGYIMGNHLILGKFIDGTDDVIENYEEVEDESSKTDTYHKPISPRERFLERRKRTKK